MINRRFIRVKVLQMLYAYLKSGEDNFSKAERELNFSIDKTYDLYFYILQLLVELKSQAEKKIEIGKNKKLPTHSDLNPNTKFVDNRVLVQLSENEMLRRHLINSKLSWAAQPALIKKLYTQMTESEFYIKYMSAEVKGYNEDKRFVIDILKEVILESEDLEYTLEELSIYWPGDFDFVLKAVINTINFYEKGEIETKRLLPQFNKSDDEQYLKEIYRKTLLNYDKSVKIIGEYTKNWDFDRIATIDTLILNMAICEFMHFPSIPTKVTLNEYVELSKFFSTQKSSTFINGILDRILKDFTKDDKIVKLGRGLIG